MSTSLNLLRPARKGEKERTGGRLFGPLRQVIESINDTFKGQNDEAQQQAQNGRDQPKPGLQRHAQRLECHAAGDQPKGSAYPGQVSSPVRKAEPGVGLGAHPVHPCWIAP